MIRITIVAMALVATCMTAQAALISWAASPDVPDADDAFQYSQPLVALLNGQDIYTGLWWDDVAAQRYFRMDIQRHRRVAATTRRSTGSTSMPFRVAQTARLTHWTTSLMS